MVIRLFTLAFLSGVTLYTLPALAGENTYPRPPKKPPLEARAEVGLRPGTERSIALTEFWVPIAQNASDGSVIYGDLRMMGDDNDNREFNIGAGYRKMVQSALSGAGIVGGHVWYDRRLTERGSSFNQITAGMEWFSDIWDAKINAYLPLNKSKTYIDPNPNGLGGGFVANQIVVNTDQTSVEEALKGLDLELGMKISFLDKVTDSTRIYGGVYHFEGDRARDVSGWRARVSSDISSDIQVGARFQKDAVRGSQGFLEATIRFPFGNKQSYKDQGLYARLDESPERDIDIVSNEVVTDAGLNVPLTNGASGVVQEIFHVDNTATPGGNGSNEARFNTLAAAQAAAGANDIIYVHRGNGTSTGMNAGINLAQQGQMLIGSGSDLRFNTGRFGTRNGNAVSSNTILLAGVAPVITNTGGSGIRITGADSFISGINVSGATTHGILGIASGGVNLGSITIENVTSSNNTQRGIFILATAGGNITTSSIKNTTSSNNTLDGILIETSGVGSSLGQSVIQNTVTNNNSSGRGIFVVARTDGDITNSSIINATSNSNFNDDILVESNGVGSTITQSSIQNTTTNSNSERGIYILATADGDFANSSITSAISNSNLQGIFVQSNGAGSTLAQSAILNTTTNNNTQQGIVVLAINDGDITNLSISGATANTNNLNGFYIETSGAGSTVAQSSIVNSTANTNGAAGIQLRGVSNGVFNTSISGSRTTGNATNGVFVDDDTTSSFVVDLGGGALGSTGGNSIFGNTGTDIRVDLDGGELKAENNWWGVGTGLAGGEITLEVGSTIDSTPFLTTSP